MKKATLALTALLLLGAIGCNGIDDITIGPAVQGRAFDAATNQPLEGVAISIAGRNGTTLATGTYYIVDVPKGTHTLTATKSGYATYTAEITVTSSLNEKRIDMVR